MSGSVLSANFSQTSQLIKFGLVMAVEMIKMSLYHNDLNGLVPGPDGKGTIIVSLVEWLRSQAIFTGGVGVGNSILIKVVTPPNHKSKWVASIEIDKDLNIDIWGPGADAQTHLSDPGSFDIIKEAVCKWRAMDYKILTKIWSACSYGPYSKSDWVAISNNINAWKNL